MGRHRADDQPPADEERCGSPPVVLPAPRRSVEDSGSGWPAYENLVVATLSPSLFAASWTAAETAAAQRCADRRALDDAAER